MAYIVAPESNVRNLPTHLLSVENSYFPWGNCVSLTSVSAVPVSLAASAISVLELVVVHAEVVVVSPRSANLLRHKVMFLEV